MIVNHGQAYEMAIEAITTTTRSTTIRMSRGELSVRRSAG